VSEVHPAFSPRHRWVAAALTACILALSACGVSGSNGTQSGSASTAFLPYSECMRSHGVPNFPDPSAGGGIQLTAGSGINPLSPSFKAAREHCVKLLPGGGPPKGVTEQQKEQLVQTAECMRAHGVTGFPDPTTIAPSNPQNYSIAEGIGGPDGGLFLLVPKTIDVNSPVFKQAGKACNFR
jgi:hypothetical protein